MLLGKQSDHNQLQVLYFHQYTYVNLPALLICSRYYPPIHHPRRLKMSLYMDIDDLQILRR